MDIIGKKVIILNDFEDAHNLLEKKGSVYSDRARPVLLGEMLVSDHPLNQYISHCIFLLRGGMEHLLAFVRYGDEFRLGRRYISQFFNSREYVNLYPILEDQVKILIQNLYNSPEHFSAHLDR